MATAPLHEVVANVGSCLDTHRNPYAAPVADLSMKNYVISYGESIIQVLDYFALIIKSLEKWFAPNPVKTCTIITLAEFILQGAIDYEQVKNDLFISPPLIPEQQLPGHLNRFGLPYFSTGYESLNPAYLDVYPYNVYDITGRLEVIISGIQKAQIKRVKRQPETAIEQILYIAKVIPRFHQWLQCMDVLSWLKRRILDAISDVQEMIKGAGFDLQLVEAWQSDMSPYIRISIPNKSTGEAGCFNFGRGSEHPPRVMLEKEDFFLNNSIAYFIQSDKTAGIWYAPACDEGNSTPITPTVFIMQERDRADHNLASGLQTQNVFESLRVQVGEGKGISCLLRPHYDSGCCGRAGLMWSIYQAGLKAKEELGWQPSWWVEPECSKPDKK